MGLTNKQRVKVNAALSMIHAQGYDAQSVVNVAKGYQKAGHDPRRAFEMALNEFAAGQPDIAGSLGKITRLVEASCPQTVAQYDQALSAYIATGDDSAIAALGPMIARDSVRLAVKNGELSAADLSAENVEAALGFAMAEDVVTAAAQAEPAAPAHSFAFKHEPDNPLSLDATQGSPSQVSPFAAGGRVANQARWDAAPVMNSGGARTLTQGHQIGTPGSGANTI